eukprot:14662035-Alexandrium_andersonii.AAC.1
MRGFTDSDAARAIAHRMGPGRVRHLDLKTLFVQDYIKNGSLELRRVSWADNPSDVLAKYVSPQVLQEHAPKFGLVGAQELFKSTVPAKAIRALQPWKKAVLATTCFLTQMGQAASAGELVTTTTVEDSD